MPPKRDINAALKKLSTEQTEPYMPQREIPEGERLNEDYLGHLNNRFYPDFFNNMGIILEKPGEKVPKSGDVPRLFIMDEKDLTPKTLEEAGVETGSRQFWEIAQQGKLFGYPAGSKEAVQVQVKFLSTEPRMYLSAPLTKSHEEFKLNKRQPVPKDLPDEVARPGFFARLMNRINSNWYKKENEDYRKYQAECDRIERENREAKEAYDKEFLDGKAKCEQLGKQMNEAANKAYGPKRTEADLKQEKEAFWTVRQQKDKAYEEKQLADNATSAKFRADYLDEGIKTVQSFFGKQPRPLDQYAGKQYKVESFSQLKPVELPQDLKIGNSPVDEGLFTNLALHATMDKNIVTENYLEQKRKLGVADPEGVLRSEGLSQEEVDKHCVRKGYGLIISDAFNSSLRSNFDGSYFKQIQGGRESAEKAIRAYQAGDVTPLAKIIAAAAENVSAGAKNETTVSQCSLNDARLTCELLDLLEEDQKLKAAAEQQGLTKKMIKDCRGLDLMRDLKKDCLEAESKLAQATAEHREMSQEEKKNCLHDIFKYRTAEASLKEELETKNNPELQNAANEVWSHMMPSPDRKAPLPSHIAAEIVADHLTAKLLKSPSVFKELRKSQENALLAEIDEREPEPDNLDKLADMTIEGMGLDQKSTDELTQLLVNNNGPTGKELLGEQGKIMQKQQKAQEEEKALEQQLNNGVIYADGPQV